MAKKRGKPKQQRIPGTEITVPEEVLTLAEDYCGILAERMELQQRENTLRADLMTAMKEHKVKFVDLDDWEVERVNKPAEEKIKTKKKKEDPSE